ncbi:MAG: MFS transporter, partial [Pseudomonadota bacterium]
IAVVLIGVLGWRSVWGLAAGAALVCACVLPWLLRTNRTPSAPATNEAGQGLYNRHWTRGEALGHWLFWVIALGFFAPPVFGTALFFHQVHLVEVKGWTLQGYTAFMPAFTLASVTMMVLSGGIVDRLGTTRLMPLCLVPFSAALMCLSLVDGFWIVPIGLGLFGATQGMMITLSAALWPEIYGTQHLGKVRSVATALMVLGSALGPGVTGALIDWGVTFEAQMIAMAAYMLAISSLYIWVFARVGRALAAAP